MNDVIVVGAGPTGVMLANELKLHGISVAIVDRDPEPSPMVRSMGLHARSIEIMEMRGLLDRLLPQGTKYPTDGFFAGIRTSEPVELDTTHPYTLGIPQPLVEAALRERATELGIEIRRGVEAVGVTQDAEGVDVELSDGTTLRSAWVVGCDGGRSMVRRLLDIPFPGESAKRQWILGEAELTASLDEIVAVMTRVRETHRGFGAGPVGDGVYRIVVPAAEVADEGAPPPTLDDLRTQLTAYAGTDFGVHSPRWLSRFGDATRLAEHYRVGRVLIAGDAAHVHPPQGGQGLNLGLQDAFNLGWKLAATINGWAPEGLLDTYEAERHPVAEEVLTVTRAQAELQSPEPGPQAVKTLFAEVMEFPGVHAHLLGKVTSLGIRYAVSDASDLLGRRQRDVTFGGGGSLYPLLHSGRGVLVDQTGELSVEGWADRVDVITEQSDELPAPAVLLRPDGHIVWMGEDATGLSEAFERWFGASSVAREVQ
ncbi:putative rifampin monooxygenase [Janibacter sp. HTCC2649]|uniref:FAD-dependent monooxygenase n=1 Tax=Janibacter sp. HTCC2649 TaxID=313589 RepID=UPI000067087B|nr:FAD-dependent monooxygenase [Janibacter sp. HTCC2649]EAQ00922.1 putative rifampin monooxygenase [Janibacter sp. HTCC2649]